MSLHEFLTSRADFLKIATFWRSLIKMLSCCVILFKHYWFKSLLKRTHYVQPYFFFLYPFCRKKKYVFHAFFFSTHFFFRKCNFENFWLCLSCFRERWPPVKHESTFKHPKTQFFHQKTMISTNFQFFGQKRIFLFENQPFKIGNYRLPRHWNSVVMS